MRWGGGTDVLLPVSPEGLEGPPQSYVSYVCGLKSIIPEKMSISSSLCILLGMIGFIPFA